MLRALSAVDALGFAERFTRHPTARFGRPGRGRRVYRANAALANDRLRKYWAERFANARIFQWPFEVYRRSAYLGKVGPVLANTGEFFALPMTDHFTQVMRTRSINAFRKIVLARGLSRVVINFALSAIRREPTKRSRNDPSRS